ncbi:ribosomal-protein-alanine N-acetyltransferase [Stenotrophomonas sp. AN71]|uniref:GNAT family N-acetyltransferase n=1 Tax=Stenotrophomonas sp. AN71 TaxID=3156253 RepID=UPI003D22A36D
MTEHLQPVQPEHHAAIAAWLDSSDATLRWAGPGVAFPLPPGQFAQALQLAERPGWVLLDEHGQCVGFGQFWPTTSGTMHLGRIIVSPQVRGRGLGRALMQALAAQASGSAAVERLTLRVYRDNTAAIALYSGLGFQPVDADSTGELLFMACSRP